VHPTAATATTVVATTAAATPSGLSQVGLWCLRGGFLVTTGMGGLLVLLALVVLAILGRSTAGRLVVMVVLAGRWPALVFARRWTGLQEFGRGNGVRHGHGKVFDLQILSGCRGHKDHSESQEDLGCHSNKN